MKAFFLLLGLVGLGLSSADAEVPVMVEMEATFLRASSSEMSAALTQAGASAGVLNAEELGKTLAALKQAGVTPFGNPRCVSVIGTKVIARSGREFPYPTDYAEDERSPGKRYPIAFETRSLGLTLEFEPKAKSDNRVEFVVVPNVVKFLGFVDYSDTSVKPPEGSSTDNLMKNALKEGGIWQPIFSLFEVRARLDLASGQTALLGGASEEVSSAGLAGESVKSSDDRLIYVFVTAKVLENP